MIGRHEMDPTDAAIEWALMLGVARAIRRFREGNPVGAYLCLEVALMRAEAIERQAFS